MTEEQKYALEAYVMGWEVGVDEAIQRCSPPALMDPDYARGYLAGRAATEAAIRSEIDRLEGRWPSGDSK